MFSSAPLFARRRAYPAGSRETQATLGELLAAEAGAVVERSPADLREVSNYAAALEYGVERLGTLPLSLRLIRELHEQLMQGVRRDVGHAWRVPPRSQNWIGLLDAPSTTPPTSRPHQTS